MRIRDEYEYDEDIIAFYMYQDPLEWAKMYIALRESLENLQQMIIRLQVREGEA